MVTGLVFAVEYDWMKPMVTATIEEFVVRCIDMILLKVGRIIHDRFVLYVECSKLVSEWGLMVYGNIGLPC